MTEWWRHCRGEAGVTVEGDTVIVDCGRDRRHRVRVRGSGEALQLEGIVARGATVRSVSDPDLRAWERNRNVNLVGFRVDRHGRLIGEAWVPAAGLTAEEFLIHVRKVAAECDLFEFHLTGRDRE